MGKQLSEKTVWEKKFQVAEAERARLDQELQSLRSALQVLSLNQSTAATTPTTPAITKSKPVTTPMITAPTTVKPVKPTPVSAEVVSNEVIPASPVMESAHSPELPPRYEAPVAATSFPENCPAPTPLELKRQQQLQQLTDMGFSLTLEQLNEKLEEHSDNMAHVVSSLL